MLSYLISNFVVCSKQKHETVYKCLGYQLLWWMSFGVHRKMANVFNDSVSDVFKLINTILLANICSWVKVFYVHSLVVNHQSCTHYSRRATHCSYANCKLHYVFMHTYRTSNYWKLDVSKESVRANRIIIHIRFLHVHTAWPHHILSNWMFAFQKKSVLVNYETHHFLFHQELACRLSSSTCTYTISTVEQDH